jgi:hypothetical protein
MYRVTEKKTAIRRIATRNRSLPELGKLTEKPLAILHEPSLPLAYEGESRLY